MFYSYLITYENEKGELIDWLEITEAAAFAKAVDIERRGLWLYDFKRFTYKETRDGALETLKIERYHFGAPSEVIYTTE